jgi:hydrazine synthase alpha subunit-like protein/F5/8 type C domain-containing protein
MMNIRTHCFALIVLTLPVWLPVSGAPKVVVVKTGSDSEAVGYEAYRALDGNPQTMWHTYFGGGEPKHPHEIVLDLGGRYAVSGFRYLPRTDSSGNGTIKDYEFYVGDNLKKLGKPAIRGTFAQENKENVVTLAAPVTGRYVKLRALSEIHGRPWSSIAELQILSEGIQFRAGESADMLFQSARTELEMQYVSLQRDIQRRNHLARYAEEVSHPASLIQDSDRHPTDVVLRRTKTLLDDLQQMDASGKFQPLELELKKLQQKNARIEPQDQERCFALFKQVCAVRRQIAFANPLLDFNEILFLKRHRAGFNHMCDQYYAIHAKPGGGIYILSDPFGENPQVRDVLVDSVVERGRLQGQKLQGGSFLCPDLSYDGRSIVFAYVECTGDTKHRHHTDPSRGHWHQGRCYHIFKVNADGTHLEQLTDGTWNDFDGCWLPNGRIVFISERRGGYLRCGRVCPTYTLYDMNPDGSDIRCLSPHETNEWHPSVAHDGMIIYTRWDYVDRHGCVAHMPWVTTPDGRNARAVHGNFSPRERRPDMELDIRVIPGSPRYVATAAPHHGQAFGSLVTFDPAIEDDDAMSPVRRITPEVDFPETQGGAQVYATAWPLSEKYSLCVYDAGMKPGMGSQSRKHVRGNYGIYLIDVFGNKELIYRDPEIACQNPMPLRARTKPTVVPDESIRVADMDSAEGTMALINVYDGTKPWPADTRIKSLRVYQILPMSVPSGAPPHEVGLRLPTGRDSVILARNVLGTVPIETDGSAYFTVPAGKELFFQALNEDGLAVQSMRSATYVQPGERLTCQGCHEPRHRAPKSPAQTSIALQRSPSKLKPDVEGTNPFSYPRLVQPVLDKHCVACHQENADKAPRLDSEVVVKGRQKWYASYFSLAPKYGFWQYGDRHRTTPGKFGARASKLHAMLAKGHHDVKLSQEEMHRIDVWLDSCSVFYGVYEKEGGEAQLRGEVVKATLY